MFRSDLHAAQLHVDALNEENERLRLALRGILPKPKSRVKYSLAVVLSSLLGLCVVGGLGLGVARVVSQPKTFWTEPATALGALPIEDAVKTVRPGTGGALPTGTQVRVRFEGQFLDGTVFTSNLANPLPYTMELGNVPKPFGFEHGMMGMQVGEKRKITVSTSMPYGTHPAGTTLVYLVEVVDAGSASIPED